MENAVLKRKAENTIDELDFKIQQLKSKSGEGELSPKFDDAMAKLERVRDHVREIYNSTKDSDNEDRWLEFDKKIYSDIQSFNEAYTSAGTIFNTL